MSEQRELLVQMRDDAAANGDFQGAAELDEAIRELDEAASGTTLVDTGSFFVRVPKADS